MGAVPLPLLTLLDERWRRAGVGCVGPAREAVCRDVGSVGSETREEEVAEAVEATEAEWARRADSSRVRRFTCVVLVVRLVCEGCGCDIPLGVGVEEEEGLGFRGVKGREMVSGDEDVRRLLAPVLVLGGALLL